MHHGTHTKSTVTPRSTGRNEERAGRRNLRNEGQGELQAARFPPVLLRQVRPLAVRFGKGLGAAYNDAGVCLRRCGSQEHQPNPAVACSATKSEVISEPGLHARYSSVSPNRLHAGTIQGVAWWVQLQETREMDRIAIPSPCVYVSDLHNGSRYRGFDGVATSVGHLRRIRKRTSTLRCQVSRSKETPRPGRQNGTCPFCQTQARPGG